MVATKKRGAKKTTTTKTVSTAQVKQVEKKLRDAKKEFSTKMKAMKAQFKKDLAKTKEEAYASGFAKAAQQISKDVQKAHAAVHKALTSQIAKKTKAKKSTAKKATAKKPTAKKSSTKATTKASTSAAKPASRGRGRPKKAA